MNEKEFCEKYLMVLETDLKGLNLTRITSFDEFYQKQYLDSVIPFREMSSIKEFLEGDPVHLDIGFGGGFPLLPVKNEFSSLRQLGLEARGKKAKAVNLLIEKLGFDESQTFHGRAENYLLDIPTLVTFKAVAKTMECLSLLNFGNKEALILVYKAANVFEIEGKSLGLTTEYKLLETFEYEVNGGKRYVFAIKFIGKVPRGTNSKLKNLVNLSSLL